MRPVAGAAACAGALLLLGACGRPDDPFSPPEVRARVLAHAPLGPVPVDPTNAVADDPGAARLGQALFYDARLSADGTIRCATCHDPERSWGNGERLGRGLDTTRRHVPTLWNVAYNRWFFWDGRADSAWSQSLKPLEAPGEHGGNRMALARVVGRDPALKAAYESSFGGLPDLSDPERFPPAARPHPDDPGHPEHRAWLAMSADDRQAVDRVFANLGKAIAAYERRIVSHGAPFDRFVAGLRSGDPEARATLDAPARRGLLLFVGRANCHTCHAGPAFTDGEFHDTGLAAPDGQPADGGRAEGVRAVLADPFNAVGPFADGGGQASERPVRYLAPRPEHQGQFKTPTLREVEHTGPYMHDGRFATLEEVVRYYSTLAGARFTSHHREQILQPLGLTDDEIADLVAFLGSLSGDPVDPSLVGSPPKGDA